MNVNYNNEGQSKSQLIGAIIGYFLGYFFGVGLVCLIAHLFSIEPTKTYGWFAGMFHGLWMSYNYLMSLIFDNGILIKAVYHTTAYSVFWWIGCVFSVICLFSMTKNLFKNITRLFK